VVHLNKSKSLFPQNKNACSSREKNIMADKILINPLNPRRTNIYLIPRPLLFEDIIAEGSSIL
jgi:hypothetical protein